MGEELGISAFWPTLQCRCAVFSQEVLNELDTAVLLNAQLGVTLMHWLKRTISPTAQPREHDSPLGVLIEAVAYGRMPLDVSDLALVACVHGANEGARTAAEDTLLSLLEGQQ